jgi:hypothetical protein
MSIGKVFSKKAQKGFTIVELLIIAPIVILVIGAFISVIVNMTGEVLMARGANSMAYNIQDALNRIEADIKLSTTFLSTNNVALASPQGYDDGTGVFHNVGAGISDALILNTLATTGNPLALTSGVVYETGQPNACNSTQISQNNPLTLNVIYFVKNNTLWRRVVMPSNYQTAGCSVPWQQPGCNPAIITTPTPQAMCQAQDERLIDNINPGDFDLQYFNSANATAADTASSNTSQTDAQRTVSLQADTTVIASINMTNTISGRSVNQSGTIRATKLDVNASTIAVVTPPTSVPVAPSVTATLSIPDNIVFSWGRVTSATSYTVNYSIAGGSYVAGATNQNITSYTVPATRGQIVCANVYANNSVGSSPAGSACATIPNWYAYNYQNAWTDYANTYATGAYTKTSTGVVVLKGLLRRTGTPTAGETIAVLPPGYRPAEQSMFQVGGVGASDRLDIRTDGTIAFATGNPAFLSLEGITFIPAGSPYSWTAFTLQNGWVNYDPGWVAAGYTIDSVGRVFTKGLVANGITTAGTAIGTLPANYRPPDFLHLPTTSNNAFDVTSFDTVGAMTAKGINQNAYRSIQHSFYAAGRATWTNLTLQNGWQIYTGYAVPQYTKGPDGIVKVKGLIGSGTTTAGTVVANLPAGYRPAAVSLQSAACNLVYCRFDVQTNGDIVTRDNVSATWSALEGITFMAEQ